MYLVLGSFHSAPCRHALTISKEECLWSKRSLYIMRFRVALLTRRTRKKTTSLKDGRLSKSAENKNRVLFYIYLNTK